MPELGRFFSAAFGGAPTADFRVESVFYSNIFLLVVLMVASTPLPSRIWARLRARLPAAEPLGNMAVMALCFISLVGRSYNPFLYFRF
jgi:alginate O-acetyltransferase complex protein AlgI